MPISLRMICQHHCALPVKDVTISVYFITLINCCFSTLLLPNLLIIKTKKTMENLTELKGDWKQKVAKLKQKFAMLTDDDVMLAEGKQDELLGRLQTKLGKTKEEIHKIISEL